MSVRIQFNDNGLSVRLMNAGDGIQREVRQSFVEPLTIRMEGAVVRETPVGATGHARQSLTHEISTTGISSVVGRVFSSDVPIKIASLETGRAPGKMPPMAPIEMWTRRVLGGDRRVAFLIARAIGRRGTRGAHMFRKGFEQTKSQANTQAATLGRAIGRLL